MFRSLAIASFAMLAFAEQDFEPHRITMASEQIKMEEQILTLFLDELPSNNQESLQKNGVSLYPGQSFRFAVEGNASTGYTWNYVESAENSALYSLETMYIMHDQPTNYTGVGGKFYFTLTAGDQLGEGNFEIWHGHAWEGR